MSKTEKNVSIGDEVTYRDRYAENGFSNGKVISKLDYTILVLEIVENGLVRTKLVDESEIENILSK